jgi:hypothetical protein
MSRNRPPVAVRVSHRQLIRSPRRPWCGFPIPCQETTMLTSRFAGRDGEQHKLLGGHAVVQHPGIGTAME